MKNVVISLFMLLFSSASLATPLFSIDLDARTDGIQSSISLGAGESLAMAIVASDNTSATTVQFALDWDTSVVSLTKFAPLLRLPGFPPTLFGFDTEYDFSIDQTIFNPLFTGHSVSTNLGTGSLSTVMVNLSNPSALLPNDPLLFLEFDILSTETTTFELSNLFATNGQSALIDVSGNSAVLNGSTSSSVPEPSALILLVLGLTGLGVMRRKNSITNTG